MENVVCSPIFLNQQVGTFMANKAAKEAADKANFDPSKSETERAQLQAAADDAAKWAPGGSYSQILTAVTAGIGGNVANGLAGMAQNAGIAYLQGLGAQEVKKLADQLEKDQNPKVESETVRAVLHAALACVGANASGQSCGAGAAGGAASVALNNALDAIQHTNADKMTAEEKLQRENLVNALVTGVAASTGGANTAATTVNAAKTEMENNEFGKDEQLKSQGLVAAQKICPDQKCRDGYSKKIDKLIRDSSVAQVRPNIDVVVGEKDHVSFYPERSAKNYSFLSDNQS
ncbi:hypothetical protein [Chromobacterium sphagni]|nr:hypothetical protein [Chromobacterium sphagni]